MTDEPDDRLNQREVARQSRLREALRENLKRRKLQSRGRGAPATPIVEDMLPIGTTHDDTV